MSGQFVRPNIIKCFRCGKSIFDDRPHEERDCDSTVLDNIMKKLIEIERTLKNQN